MAIFIADAVKEFAVMTMFAALHAKEHFYYTGESQKVLSKINFPFLNATLQIELSNFIHIKFA